MEPSFEQASEFLDHALISYSGGQIEEACQLMAEAANLLHGIELAPIAQPTEPEPAEIQSLDIDFLTATLCGIPPAAAKEKPAPAAIPPAKAESTRKSSLAVAA
jgi:hypothetical protein